MGILATKVGFNEFPFCFEAAGREPSGYAACTGHPPDGSRRSADIVSALWLTHPDRYPFVPKQ